MPKGFLYSGVRCGLKNKRRDLGLLWSETPSVGAGVFTQNLVRASCVDYSRSVVASGRLQGIVVNSGNANCMTGEQGEANTRRMALLAAEHLGLDSEWIAVASTGVIGQQIAMDKVEKGIREAAVHGSSDPQPFAEAIMTTDLVEKTSEIALGGGSIRGIAKGSGMIEPNMATMLAFIATDLVVDAATLDRALRAAVANSFNALTVDGDTSTNDMLLAMANGASGHQPTYPEFAHALEQVCVDLAKQVARDGEGATKLIEVWVRGSDDPKRVAKTIANSPLVKTAMFGCDPNWGRILAAAGRSGVAFEPTLASLTLAASGRRHLLCRNGTPQTFDAAEASQDLKAESVRIELDLGPGEEAVVYTCDFGYGYVRINAEYHT